jgi:hypothetical protein
VGSLGGLFRSPAGRSADQRYKELRAAWRERAFSQFRRPALALGGVLFLLTLVRQGAGDLDWWVGFLFGTLVATYGALWDSPPHHIEQWRQGAEGERRTAKALRKLRRRGWHVVHDLADGRANRDHVVVGPGGVFLLDTKSPGGRVTVKGDVWHVDRPGNPHAAYAQRDLANRVRRAAIRLKQDIERATDQSGLWVNAVVVVWGTFDQRIVEGDNITFVHGDELASWLGGRPVKYQPPKIEALGAALSVAARAAA